MTRNERIGLQLGAEVGDAPEASCSDWLLIQRQPQLKCRSDIGAVFFLRYGRDSGNFRRNTAK